MVAYNFQARFAPSILEGAKCQTIRRPRRRHARPGETLQLYSGMRTRQCRLIGTATCCNVSEVTIDIADDTIRAISVAGAVVEQLEAFAVADGFRDLADMAGFWMASHGEGLFRCVMVMWKGFEHG